MAVLALAVLLSFGHLVQGDMYLNSPRGSNNKLREQSNNVQNANRLFDSQNNAASGYQIGDDCKPACKDENNNYDVTKEGATKGTMKFYQGSELYIDWFVQHGCGVGHPNLRCQITLQYMTESDNPNLRDGTDQDSAGGDDEDPTEEETAEVARGYHEPLEYYQACYERERNKGLFTSDQQIEENGGATSTRQNPNGNGRRRGNQRHGLECPEERDYYPYWHPTPWHDIAIFTQEPQERCKYYRAESQNVKEKGRCSINQYNNPDACTGNGGEWTLEPAFNEPPPECWGGIASRDNHNGNVRNGHPDYYLWKIPEHIKGRVVLRIRYNITTDDFTLGSLANPTEEGTSLSGIKADPFFMDRSFNDPNPNNRRRSTFTGRPAVPVPLTQEPAAAASGGFLEGVVLTRTVQGILLLGTRLVQQSMRNALSPLLVFMAAEMDITTSQKGNLLSAIAAGYFFTQVPGGVLADWLGAKNVMTTAMMLSALCCLMLPVVVDTLGLSGLWCVMAVMGAVQGPLFPTSTVYLSKWMPKAVPGGSDEKAWGTSMLDIGISLGALLVIPVANSLAAAFGWRLAYQGIGAASLGFVGLWQVLAAEEPARCFYISKKELAFLEANVPKQEKKSSQGQLRDQDGPGLLGMPVAVALHHSLWAVFFAHIAFNYGAYYLTNWSPTYYSEVLKLTPEQAKYHLMLPHVANLICKSVNPLLVRLVERRGISLLSMRRLFTASGFLLAALCLLPVYRLRGHNPWVTTALCSAANAFFGLAPCGFKANYLDITEKYVGVISGYGNTLGTVASWVGPQFVAFLLHNFRSWDVVLFSVALMNIAAAMNYVRSSTVMPLERTLQKPEKAAERKTE